MKKDARTASETDKNNGRSALKVKGSVLKDISDNVSFTIINF